MDRCLLAGAAADLRELRLPPANVVHGMLLERALLSRFGGGQIQLGGRVRGGPDVLLLVLGDGLARSGYHERCLHALGRLCEHLRGKRLCESPDADFLP